MTPKTSAEILKGTPYDLSKPFDRGPFPPEMRMIPATDWSELMDAPFQNPSPTPEPPCLEQARRTECEHCKGVGWYETGEKLESGNNWDEPYEWEWAEADCEVCGGTGWAP